MQEIINALFTWLASSDYAQYGSIIVFIAYTLSHIVQYLPVEYTARMPDWIMAVLNAIAAKHGSDKAAKTDIKGNPVD